MRRTILSLLWVGIAAVICADELSAQENNPAYRTAFTANGQEYTAEQIPRLFEAEDFATIEAMAAELRDLSTYRPGGMVWLQDFYDRLIPDDKSISGAKEQAIFARIEAWLEAYPDSAAARVLAANFCVQLGFRDRGTGYINTVTPSGFRSFERYLNKGWPYIVAAHETGVRDPAIFEMAYQVAFLADRNSGEFSWTGPDYKDPLTQRPPATLLERIYAHGITTGADYVPLHNIRAYYYTFRWGGESGELEAFTKGATDSPQNTLGAALYPLIYESIDHTIGRYAAHDSREWDWDYLALGYEELIDLNPDRTYWPQKYAYLACLMERKEDAARLINSFDGPPIESLWVSERGLEDWRKWALENGPHLFDAELQNAVWQESPLRVRELLAAGHNPNHREPMDFPIIARAIYRNNMEIVKILREAGATMVNPTTFRAAAVMPSGEVVEYLISEGLDPNEWCDTGFSLMHFCARYGNENSLKACLDGGGDLSREDSYGYDSVTGAIMRNNAVVLDYLLRNGVDPNTRDKNRFSLFYWAAWWNQPAVAQVLFEHGADIYDARLIRQLPQPDKLENVGILFDLGLDPNKLTVAGTALMHSCAEVGDANVLALCLAHGGDINLPTSKGATPIFLAIGKDNAAMVRALLEAGADTNVRLLDNTPLALAKRQNRTEILQIFKEYGVNE